MTDSLPPASAQERLKYAAISYGEVLRHLEHEDEKANRILTGMAFLTAAAAGILTLNNDGIVHSEWHLAGRSIDLSVAAFCAFVVSVAAGVFMFLGALGPKFNIPAAWSRRDQRDQWTESTGSRLFARVIASYSEFAWLQAWSTQTDEELASAIADNYVNETHLLAVKARHKTDLMGIGAGFFRASLAPLVAFLAFTYINDSLAPWIALLPVAVLLGAWALEHASDPAGHDVSIRWSAARAGALAAASAIMAISIFGILRTW